MGTLNFYMDPINLSDRRSDLSPEAVASRQRLAEATRACREARPVPFTPSERRWNRLQAFGMFCLVMGIVGIIELHGYLYSLDHRLDRIDHAFAIGVMVIGCLCACLARWAALADAHQPWSVRYCNQSVSARAIWADIRAPDLADLYDEIAAWNSGLEAYHQRLAQYHRGELTFVQVEREIQIMFARHRALNERIEFNAHQLWFGRPLGEFTHPQPPVVVKKEVKVEKTP